MLLWINRRFPVLELCIWPWIKNDNYCFRGERFVNKEKNQAQISMDSSWNHPKEPQMSVWRSAFFNKETGRVDRQENQWRLPLSPLPPNGPAAGGTILGPRDVFLQSCVVSFLYNLFKPSHFLSPLEVHTVLLTSSFAPLLLNSL